MPPTGPLSPEQISLIKSWIDQGAEWPDDLAGEKPATIPDPRAVKMMNALRAGDAPAFARLLRDDPGAVKLKGQGGSTPLMYVTLYGDAVLVLQLIEHGADPGEPLAAALRLNRAIFKNTATAMRAIQAYAPKPQRAEYDKAVQLAAEWLSKVEPITTEDRVFQILGLVWAGGRQEVARQFAQDLLKQQRNGGGWAQTPTLTSDAYATGQALVALKEAGILTPVDTAYKRGAQFLMNTQMEDGSWYVRSRTIPFQPYFNAGFPYGLDEFISVAATNWATMALLPLADRSR